uniref:Uncharacterized protein n=1 Tax=Oryza nivara TaxID=4536 RepID=A0A0E0GUK1_ORYNI
MRICGPADQPASAPLNPRRRHRRRGGGGAELCSPHRRIPIRSQITARSKPEIFFSSLAAEDIPAPVQVAAPVLGDNGEPSL